jgi:hypothetical protein
MFCFTAPCTVRAVVFDTTEFHLRSARLSVGNVLQKLQKKINRMKGKRVEKKLLGNNDDDYGPVFEMPALWKQTANYFRRKVVSHKYWC